MCGLLLKYGRPTRAPTLGGNCVSFSQRLSVANSYWAWDRVVCPASLFMLWFCLAWACTGFAHSGKLLSYVQRSCCVQKIMCPCNHPPPLVLHFFLSLHQKWSLSLEKRGEVYVSHQGWALYILIFCSWASRRSLCGSLSADRFLRCGMREALVCG